MRALATLMMPAALCAALSAQAFHRRPPNDYGRTPDDNAATALDARLASGELELAVEPGRGRLRALLRALDVPEASQVLVFSKTSLQRHRIGPGNPRAVYFGRDAYVGWIPGARALEVAVGDDRLGLAFYTLSQDPDEPARLVRDDSCLQCHATARTHDEPGLLLRSVYPDERGDPIASAGEASMDFRAPLGERWGGWLVTGRFAGAHRGNGTAVRDDDGRFRVPARPAADLTAFADEFDARRYPVATSDIGALLALEQQAALHNLMVRATAHVRYLIDKDRRLGLAPDDGGLRPATARIVDGLARELAHALLLDGEVGLDGHDAAPDRAFAAAYAALWPRDARGVRLGELDLGARTFRLPLSPMVHADAFGRLPPPLRARVLDRLQRAVERGVPPGDVRLTRAERATLLRHLRDTLPDWPAPTRAQRER